MSSNFVKLGINYRKNMNTKSPSYGKYYASLDTQEPRRHAAGDLPRTCESGRLSALRK